MVNIFQVTEGEEGNESVIYKIEIPANRYEYRHSRTTNLKEIYEA